MRCRRACTTAPRCRWCAPPWAASRCSPMCCRWPRPARRCATRSRAASPPAGWWCRSDPSPSCARCAAAAATSGAACHRCRGARSSPARRCMPPTNGRRACCTAACCGRRWRRSWPRGCGPSTPPRRARCPASSRWCRTRRCSSAPRRAWASSLARPGRWTASPPRWRRNGSRWNRIAPSAPPASRPCWTSTRAWCAAARRTRCCASRCPTTTGPGTWSCASTCPPPRTGRSSRAPRWPSSPTAAPRCGPARRTCSTCATCSRAGSGWRRPR